jgi:5'-nucleotidase
MILLVNDDGIAAPGMRALYRALRANAGGPVLAVAPHLERSGQGHAITIDRGLVVSAHRDEGFFGFAVDGTPADCVKLALGVLCTEKPDLVICGVNDGPNVGRSLFYSGTVGAAMEAALLGFPALAVSRDRGGEGFDDAAAFAVEWARLILGKAAFRGRVLNLNLPAGPASTWLEPRAADHGQAGFDEGYRPVRDARDRTAWRLHGEWSAKADDDDAALLTAGHPILSLLAPDLNADRHVLDRLLGRSAKIRR